MIDIFDNGLNPETKLADLLVAISGRWGVTQDDDIYLGNVIIGFRYDIAQLVPLNTNGTIYPTLAIISYKDGTSENKYITQTTSLDKEIAMAVLIGRLI